jgi:hypothetical protein
MVKDTNIPVKDRNGMNKVYQAIKPIIIEKNFELTAEILTKAYVEYAKLQRNLNKDRNEGITWPYLGRAVKYYYNDKADQEQLRKSLKAVTLKALQKTHQPQLLVIPSNC